MYIMTAAIRFDGFEATVFKVNSQKMCRLSTWFSIFVNSGSEELEEWEESSSWVCPAEVLQTPTHLHHLENSDLLWLAELSARPSCSDHSLNSVFPSEQEWIVLYLWETTRRDGAAGFSGLLNWKTCSEKIKVKEGRSWPIRTLGSCMQMSVMTSALVEPLRSPGSEIKPIKLATKTTV